MSSTAINRLLPAERRRLTLARLMDIIHERGGTLAGKYKNKRTPIRLRCDQGHEWEVTPQVVLKGSWCWQCWKDNDAGKHLRLKDGLEQAQTLARKRGGSCLTTEYINTVEPMQWQCRNGHRWTAPFGEVKKRSWCPECSCGVRERLCRAYMEQLVGKKFPKGRPDWLVNSRGNRMEFDGYSEELSIAFEHHGAQHYVETTHFHRRNEKLKYRKQDDQRKRVLCRTHGVVLIEIPYTVQNDDLPRWISDKLRREAPSVPLSDWRKCDPKLYVPSDELQELRDIARERGGECLASVYLGVLEKHPFRCAKGHEWEATPANLKRMSGRENGSWCPVCKPERIGDANRKHSVEAMQLIAAERGGRFLSPTFTSVNNKYEWACGKGHRWFAAPTDVLKRTWCRKCSAAALRGSILDMRRIAAERGGECLSTEYVSSQTNLLWRCSEGHEWKARPDNVKNSGSWCPVCDKLRRYHLPLSSTKNDRSALRKA